MIRNAYIISLWMATFFVVCCPTDLVLPHNAGAAVPQGLLPITAVKGVLPWLGTPALVPVPAGPGNKQVNHGCYINIKFNPGIMKFILKT